MKEEKEEAGYVFPYLFDESQEVAAAYHAACTPDFFVFDGDRRLVYRGQLDDSRPGNDVPVTGATCARRSMRYWPAGRWPRSRSRASAATSSGVPATSLRGGRAEGPT
jgi:hypothetical protein